MGHGDFVWYDLMTADTAAGIEFYKQVIGWSTQGFPEENSPYQMWVGAQGPLGGTMLLPDEAKAMGAPPHWSAHVCVDDLDASVARVRSLGGRVYREPSTVPTIGRYAIISDEGGAPLALFQPDNPMTPHDPGTAGEFSWNELLTTDHEASMRFYYELLGWTLLSSMDMGPMGAYLIYGKDGRQLGGMMRRPAEMPMSSWVFYIHVDALDATLARAVKHGAALLHGPHTVPGGDRVAQLRDPQGAVFALHESSRG